MIELLDKNTLKFTKVKIPDDVEFTTSQNQLTSYKNFIEKGYIAAVERALDYVINIANSDVKYEIQRGDATGMESDQFDSLPRRHYPVKVRWAQPGSDWSEWFDFINIPYMDTSGVLNVNGKRKVLLGEIRSLESVSISKQTIKDKLTTSLNVSLDRNQLTILVTDKTVKIKMGGKYKDATKVMEAIYYIETERYRNNPDINTTDVGIFDNFDNAIFRLAAPTERHMISENIALEMSRYNIEGWWDSKIVPPILRKDLNRLLNFKELVGKVLATDVIVDGQLILEKGDTLDSDYVDFLAEDVRVTKLSVRTKPFVSGKYMAESYTVDRILKGVTLSKWLLAKLRSKYPNLKEGAPLEHDILDVVVYIAPNTVLTQSMIDFMYEMGVEAVKVRTSRSSKKEAVVIPFAQEYLSNRPYESEVRSSLQGDTDKLSCYDLAALISYTIRVHEGRSTPTNNRDKDFIRKIDLHNEILSDAVFDAMRKFYAEYKSNIIQFLKSYTFYAMEVGNRRTSSIYPFVSFSDMWLRQITEVKPLLRSEDDYNPLALISQINQTIFYTPDASSVPNAWRTLALPFYGRICPYETPQSKKIGLVNTITVGTRIDESSLPLSQYHVLERDEKGLKMSGRIEWLTPQDEQAYENNYRLGDVSSIDFDRNGYIKDSITLARVPASDESDEKMSASAVSALTLTHLNVIPEQHLSPSTMAMPFAGANDGARVTFGIALMKQALPLMNADIPYVTTSLYRSIFDQLKYYTVKAERSGVVTSIRRNTIIVRYDGDAIDTEIEVIESRVTDKSATVLNFVKKTGDRFEANELIADSTIARDGVYSVGANVLVAYICDEGWNYEDAIVPSEDTQHKFNSVSVDIQKIEVRKNRADKVSTTPRKRFCYVDTETSILDVSVFKNSTADKPNTHIHKAKYNGLVQTHTQRRKGETDVFKIKIVDIKPLRTGDKMAGRHGNKGVASHIKKTSEMPAFKNGVIAQIVLNPPGVVSRMNIGQLLDTWLGFCGYLLDLRMESDPFNGADTKEVRNLMKFLYDTSNCQGNYAAIRKKYDGIIPGVILARGEERLDVIMEWEDTFLPNGTAMMFNPVTGTYFENPIAFGVQYMVKTVQEADDKTSARSGPHGNVSYSQIDKQPPKGASQGGGQRVGEMEAAAIAAHGATAVLYEAMQVRSDNTPMQVNLAAEMSGMEEPIYAENELIPRAVDNFRYKAEAIGIAVHIPESIYPSINNDAIFNRKAVTISDLNSMTLHKDPQMKEDYKGGLDEALEEW